jgi:hypothetical protein
MAKFFVLFLSAAAAESTFTGYTAGSRQHKGGSGEFQIANGGWGQGEKSAVEHLLRIGRIWHF